MTARTYHLETLGCPKNQVDSDKLAGLLSAEGLVESRGVESADLVVVNTCAFIQDARRESVEVILALADAKKPDASLVVTGCLAERYGDELAGALPEADRVAGFGMPLTSPDPSRRGVAVSLDRSRVPAFDLLNLPRPKSPRPWAYVKVAEGCDRACGFCAIPGFRGPQRSRSLDEILAEVERLQAREIVLVAQDLASYGRDQGRGQRQIVELVRAVSARVYRTRLLYLYPSNLRDDLIDAICDTGVPYFDLSLQHVSSPLLRQMRRWGDGGRFLERIRAIRRREPDAAFRSNFIVGHPGETEDDHELLLDFLEEAQLDWCGFFAYSEEPGTRSASLGATVAAALVSERLAELSEAQDAITAHRRDLLIGRSVEVLADEPGVGRTHREAPEIDGVVKIPQAIAAGDTATLRVTASLGCDLEAV